MAMKQCQWVLIDSCNRASALVLNVGGREKKGRKRDFCLSQSSVQEVKLLVVFLLQYGKKGDDDDFFLFVSRCSQHDFISFAVDECKVVCGLLFK